MAHNIEITAEGVAKMASTDAAWHYSDTGHAILKPASTEEDYAEWKKVSGLDEVIEKVPAYQMLMLPNDDDVLTENFVPVEDQFWIRRQSDARCFGVVGEQYKIFQPSECIDFLRDFVKADDRFQLNTAGTLKRGAVVWANFGFAENFQVMGEDHRFNLIATTSFDGTASTRFQGRSIRTVCENTLNAGEYGAAGVTIGHRTEITKKVRQMAQEQLTQVLLSVAQYQVMGEALAQIKLSKDQAEKFLTELLFKSKLEEIDLADGSKGQAWSKPSGRTNTSIEKLLTDFETSTKELGSEVTGWTALNAITRYADHSMNVRNIDGRSKGEAVMETQLIGTASNFKAKSIAALLKTLEVDSKGWKDEAKALQASNPMLQTPELVAA